MKEPEDGVDNFCSKHGILKLMFAEWSKWVKEKIETRIEILNEHKHEDPLNSPNTKKALSIHNRFVVVPTGKATGNVTYL